MARRKGGMAGSSSVSKPGDVGAEGPGLGVAARTSKGPARTREQARPTASQGKAGLRRGVVGPARLRITQSTRGRSNTQAIRGKGEVIARWARMSTAFQRPPREGGPTAACVRPRLIGEGPSRDDQSVPDS